jgi:hypothetical protein
MLRDKMRSEFHSIVDKLSTLVSFFQQIFCRTLPSIGVEQDRFSETDQVNPKGGENHENVQTRVL